MIVAMSETTTPSSEPATGPVTTQPPIAPVVRDEPRRSRVPVAAAWVGSVAGVVFIVAVIFFSGFVLGAHSGGGHRGGPGGHKGDDGFAIIHRGPPPPGMFPMGPRGEFGPGPGGPRFEPPQPPQPPGSTATPRP